MCNALGKFATNRKIMACNQPQIRLCYAARERWKQAQMTSPTTYRNRVVEYLESGYGVNDTAVYNTDGGHRRLRFTYRGVPHTLTLHDSRDKLSGNALSMKLQDIRRELGDPPPKLAALPKRKLEDMMPLTTLGEVAPTLAALAPAAAEQPVRADTYAGKVSLLPPTQPGQKPRLVIIIPADLYHAFNYTGGLTIRRLDDETYEIEPRRGFKSPRFSRTSSIEYPFSVVSKKAVNPLIPFKPYGASPAEMVLVDGNILVTVPVATQRSKRKHAPVVQRLERAAHNGDVAGSSPAGRTTLDKPLPKMAGGAQWIDPLPKPGAMPTTDEIRGALAVLRAAEAASPLRVTRVDGKLIMQARIE